MLKLLGVTNFATIEQLEIELVPGFSVLTGETGAGKSIIVDAEPCHVGPGQSVRENVSVKVLGCVHLSGRSLREAAGVFGVCRTPSTPSTNGWKRSRTVVYFMVYGIC